MNIDRRIFAQVVALLMASMVASHAALAAEDTAPRGRLMKMLIERRSAKHGETADTQGAANNVTTDNYGGRAFDMYLPSTLLSAGARSMIVILHGGLGNAQNVRRSLQMDAMADKYGFAIAYLNGATEGQVRANMYTWNAGGACCGPAAKKNVDDVGYITAAVHFIAQKYGVNEAQIYGMGHSNGAMMTNRLMCETNLYQAAVPVSGTLNLDTDLCAAARGKRILALHGAKDVNVPIAGGKGEGISQVDFKSQAYSKAVFERSGASYTLDVVPNATHSPQTIREEIMKNEGTDMGEKVVEFFGLSKY